MSKTIGILTGGGDCPGLNSVIYGILLKAAEVNYKVIGIKKGWKGFLENQTCNLDITQLGNLHTVGGTMIYTSRTNPYKQAKKIKDPAKQERAIKETAEKMASQMDKIRIDILITIGGDDTLSVAHNMYHYAGAKVIGVPKTIDNDLSSTDYTFGFWSAVQLASNAMDNIATTARSHQRIFVIQVMGRDAGWLTLVSGISAGATSITLDDNSGFPTSGSATVNGDTFTWTGKGASTLTGIPSSGSNALSVHQAGDNVKYDAVYTTGQVWYLAYSNLVNTNAS